MNPLALRLVGYWALGTGIALLTRAAYLTGAREATDRRIAALVITAAAAVDVAQDAHDQLADRIAADRAQSMGLPQP